MFKVRAETSVCGNCRPLVAQNPRFRLAEIHHRLNRENHAFSQSRAVSAGAVVGDLRLFVQPRSDAMPNELPHHAESRGFHMLLHRSTNIADGVADPGLLNAPVKDRKSTRLNSSHLVISYAVFCLKK